MLLACDQSGKAFNASACEDNCVKWILKTEKERYLTTNLRNLISLGSGEFEINILIQVIQS